MSELDAHQTLVVKALAYSATLIANTESSFDSRLAALQERADRLVIMYETPLHWCVEGWTSAYKKAKAGNITSINSPFVSTGRNGYRFSLRVYPFGHDSGGCLGGWSRFPVQSSWWNVCTNYMCVTV